MVSGILDLEDLMILINPFSQNSSAIPDNIQHYPIINSKLNVLAGEETKRRFDFKLVITNPDAISEIETNRKNS